MSFKIRSKPIKPVRKKNVKYTKYIYDGDNLASLNDWLYEHNATLDDVTIEKEWGYYDEVDIMAVICVDESDRDFQQRSKYYETRKKKYDDWYKTHEKSIKKELERRKKEKVKLEKKLARLNKEFGE